MMRMIVPALIADSLDASNPEASNPCRSRRIALSPSLRRPGRLPMNGGRLGSGAIGCGAAASLLRGGTYGDPRGPAPSPHWQLSKGLVPYTNGQGQRAA